MSYRLSVFSLLPPAAALFIHFMQERTQGSAQYCVDHRG